MPSTTASNPSSSIAPYVNAAWSREIMRHWSQFSAGHVAKFKWLLIVYFYVEKKSISSENLCLRGHKNADQRLLMIIPLKDTKHQLKRSRKIRDSIGFASAQHLETLPAPLACGFTVRKSQLLNAFVLCSRVAAIRHVAGHSVCCILLPSDAVLFERSGFFQLRLEAKSTSWTFQTSLNLFLARFA